MLKAADKLPKGTETCVVEGGNHRGFASYSLQPLDWEVSKDRGWRIAYLNIVGAVLTRFYSRYACKRSRLAPMEAAWLPSKIMIKKNRVSIWGGSLR